MKRITISISVLLLFVSFALDNAFAQPGKSINQAVVDGDINRVKTLLSEGADVNSKNRMGWTLLHTAIHNKQQEIATMLLEKGADIKTKDNRGRTPLHLAAETGQKVVVEQLIAKGAEINVMDSRADNALSLAKKNNHKEITDLLVKNGAQDPDPTVLFGDRLYSSQASNRNPNSGRLTQQTAIAGNAAQTSVVEGLLAKPNEIKTRVKTFDGLEKSLKVVSDKSQNEERQWLQTRYDNRTTLLRAVEKQIVDEIEYIGKVAVEESATKTAEAVKNMQTERRKRSLKVNRELLKQKREQRQTATTSTSTRGRTSSRYTRGRTSTRSQVPGTNTTGTGYGRGAAIMSGGEYGTESGGRPPVQLDPKTEEQMRLWSQAAPDNKLELAKAIQPQIQAEIGLIRAIAVEEKAKKTTAAIDGLLLARKERFDGLVIKMEEEKRKLQETQSLRNRTNDPGQAIQQNSRTRGRTSGRTTGTQTDTQQRGTRTRRR